MTTKEKAELMRLLNLYQAELVIRNEANIKERGKHEHSWQGTYYHGVKAKFNHARVLASSLAVEISHEMKSIWQL